VNICIYTKITNGISGTSASENCLANYILGERFNFDIEICVGAGAYIRERISMDKLNL
jgi:NADH:ubiquinone oxidoreductase subunit F (NADH-binding)